MSIRVLLICREGTSLQKYLDACKEHDARIDVASSFEDIYKAIVKTSYNGILIDMQTKIITLSKDKGRIDSILELYPVARLTFNDKSGQLCVFYSNQVAGSGTLENFITQQCRSFTARTIRSDRRRDIIFNVILSKSKNISDENSERTVTMNISRRGCFIFSIGDWEVNNDAWFIIKELSDQTPIRGQVRWKVDWGNEMSIPGIGVQFSEINDCQLKEFCEKSSIQV
ncbi:MAG: PilZ domain-containing protein [Candidatus Scalindua sp.]